ncbi:Rv0361 family membrane protein [Leucobacter sp. gxy201]|uniref:Rv0361 family membrane protein n=1 Tax=Leucobacter sp. gxy201 TaxID=2957200 RepID=UPI003DA1A11E
MSEIRIEAGAQPPAPQSAPAGGSRVPTRVWWLTAVVALCVLGSAGAVIWANASSEDTVQARAVAQEYVDAIAAGDAETANAHARTAERQPESELLHSDALSRAERINGAAIDRLRVDPDRGTATGSVEYELDHRRFIDRIELARDADGWYVLDGLTVELSIGWYGDEPPFSIAGFDGVLTGPSSIEVYPAVYEIEAPNEYFEVEGDGRMVAAAASRGLFGDEGRSRSYVWTVPTEAYWDELQRQADAWYDECAKRETVPELQECGIELDAPAQLEDAEVEVEIVAYPVVMEDYGWKYPDLADGGDFRVRAASRAAEEPRAEGASNGFAGPADVLVEFDADGAPQLQIVPYT